LAIYTQYISYGYVQDIKIDNVLVNHFGADSSLANNEVRSELRSDGKLIYALFDFDISIMAPPDAKKGEYRLPYHMSWWGSFNQPMDTAQGEFDYDPFAFDVGMLGSEFCQVYQVTI
jgi:hypothetical protein